MKTWAKILTVLVAIETFAIGIYCCSKLEVNINSPSVLISALGVLVTFVVAWQIWQTMASREEIKEAREVAENLHKMEARLNSLNYLAEAHLLFTQGGLSLRDGLGFVEIPLIESAEGYGSYAMRVTNTNIALTFYFQALSHYIISAHESLDNVERCVRAIESAAMRIRRHVNALTPEQRRSDITMIRRLLRNGNDVLTEEQTRDLETWENWFATTNPMAE